jgi:ribA/ribD-fused uncharacterized protein
MEDTLSFTLMMAFVNGNSDGTGSHGPRATKGIGRKIKPWIDERWTKYRPQVALDVLTQKFSSHPDMSDLLRSTGRATLAEAADPRVPPDIIWGTGIVTEAILHGEKWPTGRNLQGHSLQLVRARLSSMLGTTYSNFMLCMPIFDQELGAKKKNHLSVRFVSGPLNLDPNTYHTSSYK